MRGMDEPVTGQEMHGMLKWSKLLEALKKGELMWIVALAIVRGKINEPSRMLREILAFRPFNHTDRSKDDRSSNTAG